MTGYIYVYPSSVHGRALLAGDFSAEIAILPTHVHQSPEAVKRKRQADIAETGDDIHVDILIVEVEVRGTPNERGAVPVASKRVVERTVRRASADPCPSSTP